MNTKTTKILVSVLCFVLIAILSVNVFAEFRPSSVTPNTTDNLALNAQAAAERITGAIKVVGIILSVGILMVLGIKYMMGSAEEKAEYKKTLIPYVVGAMLVFAASYFADKIYDFANSFLG